MAARFKILHTADTHIGAELPRKPRRSGPRRGDDFVDALNRVLALARSENVNLVIHAGDLFDSHCPSSSAMLAAVLPIRRLADDGIPILIVPGNHERCLLPESPFLIHPNILLVDKPITLTIPSGDTRVAVSAIPCIHHGGRESFTAALELTGWKNHAADVRVLAVHQAFDTAVCGPANFRFPATHADVVSRAHIPSEFNYVAAGHIPRHQKLRPADRLPPEIVYAGSPDRITFAEKDEPKGCVLIELHATGLNHRFIEHAVRPMSVWPIALSGMDRAWMLAEMEKIVTGLAPHAIAQIRVGGVIDRAQFSGLRLRQIVESLRPDAIVQTSFRGIDFADPSSDRTIAPTSASAFDVLEPRPARIYSATPTNLRALPKSRGVYAMYDGDGRLLYIGKATDLRARARTHLGDASATNYFSGWTRQVARLESLLVSEDDDALRIEAALISRHRPPFNWVGT
ncbi:MAG: metallophosphoesterase [Planctomycetes bacterium]|nr:metallophosphoesterase [Planctomycetota bacterium]